MTFTVCAEVEKDRNYARDSETAINDVHALRRSVHTIDIVIIIVLLISSIAHNNERN